MSEWGLAIPVALAALAGLGLGAFHFLGLAWTLRRALPSQAPALWLLGSLVLRGALVGLGFFAVGGGEWSRWLACALGFIVARHLVTRSAFAAPVIPPAEGASAQEADHAA